MGDAARLRLPADAVHVITLSQAAVEASGAFAEYLVTHIVPESIVHLLETVEIQKEEGPLQLLVPLHLVQELAKGEIEQVSIAQFSELVMIGQVLLPL